LCLDRWIEPGLTASRTVENKQPSFGWIPVRKYGWFLTSRDALDSLDVADHVRWICRKIAKPEVIAGMREKGDVRLSCFWSSDGGGGGPVIPKELSAELAQLGLDLNFDLYLGSDETRH
jgi:hypothetical protein